MKLAIVILNWNGAHMLRKYLPSVISNSPEGEVIIADNASTDDSLDMLKKDFPDIRTIVLNQNYGFAEGYNKALSQINAEYYILLNSDVDVPQGWLKPMIKFMDSTPETAACQPKLLALKQPEYFEYAGAAGGFIDKYGYPFCKGRIFNTVERDKGQYDGNHEILWATGACLMIRSKDYWEAGGLDGRFFAHNEEIDLCWRLRLMGRHIFCISDSTAFHLGGGTLPKGNPRKTYLNFRNNLTMLYKNLNDKELKEVMRMRLWLDWLAAFQMLILGRSWGDFKAVINARREFNRWKHSFDVDRKRIQSLRKVDSIPERIDKSILWLYYAKGVKSFDKI